MVIISKSILNAFVKKHPEAQTAVLKWYDLMLDAHWKNFSELKQTFRSADAVGNDRYVFDLKGNHYRLVALIIFKVRTVFILFLGSHAEYDLIDASTISFNKKSL